MGQEALCTVQVGDRISEGKALLETDSLIFRGDFRLSIPFREILSVDASDGQLRIRYPQGTAQFHLGPAAEKWAHKILHPKTLLEKLGVKEKSSVAIVGEGPEDFQESLRRISCRLMDIKGDPDLIFLFSENQSQLKFGRTGPACRGVWVVYPKGKKNITEAGVLSAGRNAGLVDLKVVRFSETHTALKFVAPKSKA